jgi:hypothetical protein
MFAALVLLLIPVLSADNPIAFPGRVSELASPDGRYVLRNVDSDQEPHHVLYLEGAQHKNEKLMVYGRHASALWSRDGQGLLVNDYGGSDHSNCLLFLFGVERKRIDVRERLREQLGSNETIFGNHHVYVEGVEWISRDRVSVKVSGYGDVNPKGFTLLYDHSVGGRFRLVKRTKGGFRRFTPWCSTAVPHPALNYSFPNSFSSRAM